MGDLSWEDANLECYAARRSHHKWSEARCPKALVSWQSWPPAEGNYISNLVGTWHGGTELVM